MMRRALLVLATVAAGMVAPVQAAQAVPETVITVGTSIEYGTGHNPGESWPEQLALRAPEYDFSDMSLPGGAWTANNTEGDSIRQHMQAAIAESPDEIIVGGPVNDLVRLGDVTPLRQAVFEEVTAARNAGIHVIVMAIFPFNDGGAFQSGWWPNLDSRRSTYNTWCASMYGADCVNVGWALKETTTARGDNRWFRDGLHFTRLGALLVAQAYPLERLAIS